MKPDVLQRVEKKDEGLVLVFYRTINDDIIHIRLSDPVTTIVHMIREMTEKQLKILKDVLK